MVKFVKILIVVVVLLVAVAATIHLSGNTRYVVVQILKPRHGFDLAYKAPRLDYADPGAPRTEHASLHTFLRTTQEDRAHGSH